MIQRVKFAHGYYLAWLKWHKKCCEKGIWVDSLGYSILLEMWKPSSNRILELQGTLHNNSLEEKATQSYRIEKWHRISHQASVVWDGLEIVLWGKERLHRGGRGHSRWV